MAPRRVIAQHWLPGGFGLFALQRTRFCLLTHFPWSVYRNGGGWSGHRVCASSWPHVTLLYAVLEKSFSWAVYSCLFAFALYLFGFLCSKDLPPDWAPCSQPPTPPSFDLAWVQPCAAPTRPGLGGARSAATAFIPPASSHGNETAPTGGNTEARPHATAQCLQRTCWNHTPC